MGFYESLGVRPVINAAGTLTSLGGSLMAPAVLDAMSDAAGAFVDMGELHLAAGRRIAELLGVEAAHVVACASAGITSMAAACMTRGDPQMVARLPDTAGMRDRFVVQRTHRTGFDRGVLIAGGRFQEVEPDEESLRRALGDSAVAAGTAAAPALAPAALYYTLAWFCDGPAVPLERTCEIAHAGGIPVIVDAAAEVPPVRNFVRFLNEGADLVTFSGGKAVCGPQSSGIVIGRTDLVAACAAGDSPNMGVGRGMKAGKEEIAGLVTALEHYVLADHGKQLEGWQAMLTRVARELETLSGVSTRTLLPHGVGQQIPYLAVSWSPAAVGLHLEEAARLLLEGSPRVAVQVHNRASGEFNEDRGPELRVHPHTLRPGEEIVVARRLRRVIEGRPSG